MPGHVRAFQAVTSRFYDNIVLWSCWIDSEPGVAIVMLDDVGEGKVAVMPLFVAITEKMEVRFESEQQGGSDGGGPTRSTMLDEFAAGLASLVPGGGK